MSKITRCLLFFVALQFSSILASSEDGLILAEDMFEAGLFEDSIDAYNCVVSDPTDELQLLTARLRIAIVNLKEGRFQGAIEPLEANVKTQPATLAPNEEEVRQTSIYFLGLSYKALGKYAEAKFQFMTYLKSAPKPLLLHDRATFELAKVNLSLREYAESRALLTSLNTPSTNSEIRLLAILKSAELAIAENHPLEADGLLKPFLKDNEELRPFKDQIAFLLGVVAYQQEHYADAVYLFSDSIHKPMVSWHSEALYLIGKSHVELAKALPIHSVEKRKELAFAVKSFEDMVALKPQEKGYLALAQSYMLPCADSLDKEAQARALVLLERQELFTTQSGQQQALLLRARASQDYIERDRLYQQIVQMAQASSGEKRVDALAWYDRGLNDLNEADRKDSQELYKKAADSFLHAFELLSKEGTKNVMDTQLTSGDALKYQAMAIAHINPEQAYALIDRVIHDQPSLWALIDTPAELLYLQGIYASKFDLNKAVASLKEAFAINDPVYSPLALKQLADLYYHRNDRRLAEEYYLEFVQRYPELTYAGEALFWSACCAEDKGASAQLVKERKKRVYEQYPKCSLAPDAYFTLYSYEEYLQGDKEAVKHLQSFVKNYKNTPVLIEANFLLGLDNKHDRKTPEGKWIRKKSLTDAIDAFQQAEVLAERLDVDLIEDREKVEYYTSLRYRAMLERALANLSIAMDAQGAKEKIYLDYAEEVFANLVKSLDEDKPQIGGKTLLSLYDEALFGLSQTHIRAGKELEADRDLAALIERYSNLNLVGGYYLARAWDERGRIAMRHNDFLTALDELSKAEALAKSGVLSTDQRLDLWIQKGLCLRCLGQYDQALLTLSKVVNDDAISSLRLKAMFLRAETYQMQGRSEVARKQLESLMKKGGGWAVKAKEKLEKEYGY